MKKLYIILFAGVLVSCNSVKTISGIKTGKTDCTDCSVQILNGKNANLITVGKNDISSYTISEDTNYTVVKYSYQTGKDPDIIDSGYTEEFIFQLPGNISEGSWSGKEIAETKAFLGVWCFCKDKAGYYKIDSGSISLKNNIINISIPEVVDQQFLKNFSIQLK